MLIADRLSSKRLFKREDVLVGKFTAMGCSCEILVDTEELQVARDLVDIASREALRVEAKFSRYRDDNIVHQINGSRGAPLTVDAETAQLLDFADQCHHLSDGLFDISSGVLRNAWRFDGGDRVPDESAVARILPLVGWSKVVWKNPVIQLMPGMEIDLGGIGKEYAVDRAVQLIRDRGDVAALVNFGGDIAVTGPRKDKSPWVVGIEDVKDAEQAVRTFHLKNGALATSGDSKKYVLKNGKRYGHILDPRSGWPIADGFRSVTVAADTCSEAGFLSTLGILSGKNATAVLNEAAVQCWCY